MAQILPPALRELSRKAAIVGVGETDYGDDYRAERAKAPGYQPPGLERLVTTAFERALDHAGLIRADIDGLTTSYIYGGPSPEDAANLLGVRPKFLLANGNIMAGPLPVACAAIAEGKADTIAMIYCADSRASGRQYGGATYGDVGGTPSSYYYHHPWGWSSQAAHWALMRTAYQDQYGIAEEAMAAIAIQVREHATMTPQAIMTSKLTVADYIASRYIVRPMHLFDMCLVNDGAVCLIVSRTERARDQVEAPVLVAGWGESKVKHSKLHAMVRERLSIQMRNAGDQALAMAGIALADIGHFEGYDVSTMHLVNQLEGFGFAEPGHATAFCKTGEMTLGGRIPTNMAGGNLSGAYMHGWSQSAEVVRQLMGQAGARQIAGLRYSMSSLVQTDQAHPIIYEGTAR
jgi:acetyl-CoA acetyltransferase